MPDPIKGVVSLTKRALGEDVYTMFSRYLLDTRVVRLTLKSNFLSIIALKIQIAFSGYEVFSRAPSRSTEKCSRPISNERSPFAKRCLV